MPALGHRDSNASPWRADRNRKSLARLAKALPNVFPAPVLVRAMSAPFAPPLPRLAVDAYWRAHPLRADKLTRALAARGGAPIGWTWRLGTQAGLSTSFRVPPTPYREPAFSRGPGHCRICGQPVFRFGWHDDPWAAGPSRKAEWHASCVVAWRFWSAPSSQARLLKRVQKHRCAQSGGRLWRSAEIDHALPLFKVWRERRDAPWPELLAYWGLPNLKVINRDAHAAKSAAEHAERAEHAGRQRHSASDKPFWPSVRTLLASLQDVADAPLSEAPR